MTGFKRRVSVPWWTGLRKEDVHRRRRGAEGRHYIMICKFNGLAKVKEVVT